MSKAFDSSHSPCPTKDKASMAAPPSKPSPSSQDVLQKTNDPEAARTTTTKGAPTSTSSDAAATDPHQVKVLVPSYETSTESEYYLVAKKMLAEGEFEEALASIEQGIEHTKARLISLGMEHDFHESIAPYHYLYGTTLLYSIEESNDTQVTVDTQATSSPDQVVAATPADGDDTRAILPEKAREANAVNRPTEITDDMEIAWENLEAARNIVERMLAEDGITGERKSKLQLDSAQMLLREGDLQRLNGRYTEAIHDYEACLQLRKLLLDAFDRKIADTEYNLGLSYMASSTELQKDDAGSDPVRRRVSHEHCQEGVRHFLECAKIFCGQIAVLCDEKVDSVLGAYKNNDKAGLKTTGLEEDSMPSRNEASQTLSGWRRSVQGLTQSEPDDGTVANLKQLLQEIQETIDEAERSKDAVRQASKLKAQAQEAVSTSGETQPTTTTGFDKPTLPDSSSAVARSGGPSPMMVVKKKKKRDADDSQKTSKKQKQS